MYGGRPELGGADCYTLMHAFFRPFGITLPDFEYPEDVEGGHETFKVGFAHFEGLFRVLEGDDEIAPADVILIRRRARDHLMIILDSAFAATATRLRGVHRVRWRDLTHPYSILRYVGPSHENLAQ